MINDLKNNAKVRLNKAIALSGLTSRRNADKLIKSGKVKVNGRQILNLSYYVTESDEIRVENKIVEKKSFKYLILYKPRGFITTSNDEHSRKTVYDLIPQNLKHLKYAGRLDSDSEGLLLFSNDGYFLNLLQSPMAKIKKVYVVTIAGRITGKELEMIKFDMLNGIKLDGMLCKVDLIKVLKPLVTQDKKQTSFELVLLEGKNRQIRRMFQKQGLSVLKLKRIKIADCNLEGIKKGGFRELTREEAYANLHLKMPKANPM